MHHSLTAELHVVMFHRSGRILAHYLVTLHHCHVIHSNVTHALWMWWEFLMLRTCKLSTATTIHS